MLISKPITKEEEEEEERQNGPQQPMQQRSIPPIPATSDLTQVRLQGHKEIENTHRTLIFELQKGERTIN